MKYLKLIVVFVLAAILFFPSCEVDPEERTDVSKVDHPEWSKNANIYEVNVRQYTEEGTFNAFGEHLDRLEEMGVDILWFMPVSPIGEKNKKGELGSYYSVADYTAINPEFGTMEDFKNLVDRIHDKGMYVILDWVANHTAWDHYWTETNPEYYVTDEDGEFIIPPDTDWTDVIQLDYDNEELRDAMLGEMRFWIEEVNIDGFRCDVAGRVPTDFWNRVRAELEEIKPIFMLAEAEVPELHEHAFEVGYGWHLHHLTNEVARGNEDVSIIDDYFFGDEGVDFPEGAYKMNFITNHDENSWAGTVFDRYGDGVEAFAVFTHTIPGMPLIYSGQEDGLDKMLEFFEKDPIEWGDYEYEDFYKTLLSLKHRNEALWNGLNGGDIVRINTNDDNNVFAFIREKNDDKVFVVLNLNDEGLNITFEGNDFTGSYTNVFSNEDVTIEEDYNIEMDPWGYKVFAK